MALHHATSGELFSLRSQNKIQSESNSTALVKSETLEVMRMVLANGKSIGEHQVAGEITIQCLDGAIELTAHGKTQTIHPGEMVYLAGSVPHALRAVADTTLLVTILLR
jgi:quercetin dioxygenase-like cupin family protein